MQFPQTVSGTTVSAATYTGDGMTRQICNERDQQILRVRSRKLINTPDGPKHKTTTHNIESINRIQGCAPPAAGLA